MAAWTARKSPDSHSQQHHQQQGSGNGTCICVEQASASLGTLALHQSSYQARLLVKASRRCTVSLLAGFGKLHMCRAGLLAAAGLGWAAAAGLPRFHSAAWTAMLVNRAASRAGSPGWACRQHTSHGRQGSGPAQSGCLPEVVQRLNNAARPILGGTEQLVAAVRFAPVAQLRVCVGHHAAVHACKVVWFVGFDWGGG